MAGARRKQYNLLADARKVMLEPSEHTDKGHVFTVHLMAHYHNFRGEDSFPPTTHANVAPPFMNRDVMELIMTLVDTRTASEVLKARQRVMTLDEVRDLGVDAPDFAFGVLRNAFPVMKPKNDPYVRLYTRDRMWDDVLFVQFEQRNKYMFAKDRLRWSVSVDLKQIYIAERTKHLSIPDRAITVKTNVLEVRLKQNLSDALVDEMLGFRLRGTISNEGHKITFCSDSGLGFVMDIAIKHVWGRRLASYKGIAVGDTVRVVKTFQAYDFAVGLKGVVQTIMVVGRVMFVVELGKIRSAISRQIVEANNHKYFMHDQPAHCMSCQISHVEKL